jgi:hypothetical protein
MSYGALVSTEPRALAFGFLHAAAATVGQTFLIALFLPSIKAQLGIGDAQVASFFALTTLASAAALWAVGRPWTRSTCCAFPSSPHRCSQPAAR